MFELYKRKYWSVNDIRFTKIFLEGLLKFVSEIIIKAEVVDGSIAMLVTLYNHRHNLGTTLYVICYTFQIHSNFVQGNHLEIQEGTHITYVRIRINMFYGDRYQFISISLFRFLWKTFPIV